MIVMSMVIAMAMVVFGEEGVVAMVVMVMVMVMVMMRRRW